MSSANTHDILIIGAGIAGLGAAYRLRENDLVVLETNNFAGGRTESRQLGDYVYNAGAQVIMGDSSPVAQLADELGVPRTLIKKTRVPLFFHGKLYSARTQPFCPMRVSEIPVPSRRLTARREDRLDRNFYLRVAHNVAL